MLYKTTSFASANFILISHQRCSQDVHLPALILFLCLTHTHVHVHTINHLIKKYGVYSTGLSTSHVWCHMSCVDHTFLSTWYSISQTKIAIWFLSNGVNYKLLTNVKLLILDSHQTIIIGGQVQGFWHQKWMKSILNRMM